MRRALLTATPLAALSVGYAGPYTGTGNGYRMAVELGGPATRAGTITTVQTNAPATTNEVRIVTGSLSGSNFTVRSVSPALTAVEGANTYAGLSLSVLAGDFIGYWVADTTKTLRYTNTGSGAMGYNLTGPASAPTVGQVIALTTTAGYQFSILGT